MLLFKAATEGKEITVPLQDILPDVVNIIQGEVTLVDRKEKRIGYRDHSGTDLHMAYDYLVIATGSIVRKPNAAQGGIALTDLKAENQIHKAWKEIQIIAWIFLNLPERNVNSIWQEGTSNINQVKRNVSDQSKDVIIASL